MISKYALDGKTFSDDIVRSGELMDPHGHSASFCAAGFKEV